jgi:hypothetical protein
MFLATETPCASGLAETDAETHAAFAKVSAPDAGLVGSMGSAGRTSIYFLRFPLCQDLSISEPMSPHKGQPLMSVRQINKRSWDGNAHTPLVVSFMSLYNLM